MSIDSNLLHRLKNFNQEHLVAYWDDLDVEQRAILLRDLGKVDLEHVTHAFESVKDQLVDRSDSKDASETTIDQLMEPIPEQRIGSIEKTNKEQLESYRREGLIKTKRLFSDQNTRMYFRIS